MKNARMIFLFAALLLGLAACTPAQQAQYEATLAAIWTPVLPAATARWPGQDASRPEKWPTPTCDANNLNSFFACPGLWAPGTVGYTPQVTISAALVYTTPAPQPAPVIIVTVVGPSSSEIEALRASLAALQAAPVSTLSPTSAVEPTATDTPRASSTPGATLSSIERNATEQALLRQMESEKRQAQQDATWDAFWTKARPAFVAGALTAVVATLLIFGAGGAYVWVHGVFLARKADYRQAVADAAIRNTAQGPVTVEDLGNGKLRVTPLHGPAIWSPERREVPEARTSPGAVSAESAMPAAQPVDAERENILAFLRDCISFHGAASNRLASANEMEQRGWGNQQWQDCKDWLDEAFEEQGGLSVAPKGTYLPANYSLGDLVALIERMD